MKRPIFLIIATVLVLILASVWVYVLLYGNPENLGETFSDFNLNNTTETETLPAPEPEPEPEPVVDLGTEERLRQLTTGPVVGFQFIQPTPSDTPYIYYVEAGTGHIFSINQTTGEEERISRTTIPNINNAVISPNGKYVMLTTGEGSGKETLFGQLSTTTDTLLTTNINEVAVDLHPTTENTFLYLTQTNNGSVVKEFIPQVNTIETVFTIPFREAVVSWGDTVADVHYVYPKASRHMEGALYKYEAGVLQRTPVSGFGMSAVGLDNYVIYTQNTQDSYSSFIYSIFENTSYNAPIAFIPEKCTSLNTQTSIYICAGNFQNQNPQLPDVWYEGVTSFADSLWLLNVETRAAQTEINITNEIGRELDITNLHINQIGSKLLFTNKIDRTLWFYELTN